MTRILVVLLCTAIIGCAALQPDTAQMPLTRDGAPAMTQSDAIALASWALQDPTATHGKPELAARAVAAEDWLAGQTRLTDDFGAYQPVSEVSWGEVRRQVRAAIGVAPGTPSQVVVDHLLAAADALKAGDTGAAKAQLQPPAFSLGPDGTLAALSSLPAFSDVAWAFIDLARNENRSGRPCNSPISC